MIGIYTHAAAALAGAALAGLAAWNIQGWRLAAEVERVNANHAAYVAAIEQDARKAIEQQRHAEARAAEEVERIARESHEALERSRADADAARTAADGLRRQLAAYLAAARAGAAHPGPAAPGAPAGDPIGVLADVLERADRRAGVLAEFADRAHAAGIACERAYDALTSSRH